MRTSAASELRAALTDRALPGSVATHRSSVTITLTKAEARRLAETLVEDGDALHVSDEQLALLIECVDSHLYENAPEAYRFSGFVRDPRDEDDEDKPLTIEDVAVCELLDEHGDLTELLLQHVPAETQFALRPS